VGGVWRSPVQEIIVTILPDRGISIRIRPQPTVGLHFSNLALLTRLTHRSYVNGPDSVAIMSDEFLGDAVLDFIVGVGL
jgi:hypothetical protein